MMKRYAFFDVDETIISEKSMFSILGEIDKNFPFINSKHIKDKLQKLRDSGVERDIVNKAFYHELKGLPRDEIIMLSNKYITARIKDNNGFIITNVLSMFEKYRKNDYEPVFISGSAVDFIQPLAKHLDVMYCLATRLQVDNDSKYTGKIVGEPMTGQGKRNAMLNFTQQHGSAPMACAAFGDHLSDLPFLELTGSPHVIATNDQRLIVIAHQRGWPIIQP